MDPISIAVGGILMLLGIALGRLGRRQVKAIPPPRPICSCAHGLAFHDQKTGACHGTMEIQLYNTVNDYAGKEIRDCTCRQYDGPKPIEQFFAQQMLPPDGM